jgi:hypothetical protein
MSINIETLRRVWLPREGVFLEVGDLPEAPQVLELRTVRDEDKEWFGLLNFTLDPEFAIDLGQALIAAGHAKLNQLKMGM